MDIHPNIKNMQSAIQKREIDQAKISQFEKWMANPKKFKEEYREQAEQTLREAKSLLASGSGNSGYQQLQQQGQANQQYHRGGPGRPAKPNVQDKTNNATAAPAEVIGAPFHNPYTFIPFPGSAPERHKPTPLTIDEIDPSRLTGCLSVKLKNLSPLLSVEPRERNDQSPISKAMRIGNHPIVPASSIRGVLRNLTAIISGSALDYVDDELWLCQGRDAKLDDQKHTMKLFLAEILKPGNRFHDGTVLAGPAELVQSDSLHLDLDNGNRKSYVNNSRQLWIRDPNDKIQSKSDRKDAEHPWRVKVSGRKVNSKGKQHEGAFRPDHAQEITLGKELWKAYTGRYRNAEKKELRQGDLVWLEVYDQGSGLDEGRNVKSIQWARWGRTGVNFKDQLQSRLPYMLPDSIKNDGLVDITSDLFGSIALPEDGQKASYDSFAARIRPENLVFEKAEVAANQMPPLNGPHPGCKAFYVRNDDYDHISLNDLPRGYKVYRTSRHNPGEEPWKYANQPVFDGAGKPKPFEKSASLTRSCELIREGSEATLKIAFRALTKQEFSLLLLVLSCDLRIGGGKPLGLGHCVASEINAYDENGEKFLSYQPNRASLPDGYSDLPNGWISRASLYCQTQIPVENMRYPRSINRNQQGGMCWFGYFAAPKKNATQGLETIWIQRGSPLEQRAGGKDQVRAQALPIFNPDDPESDLLFGYDLNGIGFKAGPKNIYSDFNGEIPKSGTKYENISPNRNTRQEERNKR